jgi:hypothetical protein
LLLAKGSEKLRVKKKWTASEAGKTKTLASWQLWRRCRLAPWSFFRSEITRCVQGVAARCLIAPLAGDDASPDFLTQFQGTQAGKGELISRKVGTAPCHDEKSRVRAMRRTF